MTEHISCNNHVYFNSIHIKPVHAQELGEKGDPMTFYYVLQRREKKENIMQSKGAHSDVKHNFFAFGL